tara:strand:+ start:207 stop:425 length:219 start_codon:yes stop_codon:yes gene_type:complete
MYKFNYKLISNVSLDGLDHGDYPDYCDAFIDSADYDGKKMTDEELDLLNDDYELLSKLVWDNLHLNFESAGI